MLCKSLRKSIKKIDNIGKHKLNEVEALNMKFKKGNKLDKSKRSSYSLVAFKHCYSLETHLDLWRKKAIPGHLYLKKKKSEIILLCIWILKSALKFFY